MEKKVLVVDDEEANREVISLTLAEFGFTVVTAKHGEEALEMIRRHADFAAVLSDVRMPEMNGLELYKRLLVEQPRLASRFTFMSGDIPDKLLSEIRESGRPFLEKPFQLDLLLVACGLPAAVR